MIQWQNCTFREHQSTGFHDIPLLWDVEYNYLRNQRKKTTMQALQVKKYQCMELFTVCDEPTWKLYLEHPSWIANTILERFGDLDCVLKRRFNKLIQTQNNSEWTDMLGARLIIIQKLTTLLGLTELWNANGKLVGPNGYRKAERFVQQNWEQVRLAFGSTKSVKTILHSWGGHILVIHTRIRKRKTKDVGPKLASTVKTFLEFLGSVRHTTNVLSGRLFKTHVRSILRHLHMLWRTDNPATRLDVSIFKIKSPPWNTIRHPKFLT